MSRYDLRMRRQCYFEMEPMSGAGYDIDEMREQAKYELDRMEHAVRLALNYYQMRPLQVEEKADMREYILSRAQSNYSRSGGDKSEYTIQILVRCIPQSEIDRCIEEKIKMPTMMMSQFLSEMEIEEEDQVDDFTTAIIPSTPSTHIQWRPDLTQFDDTPACGGGNRDDFYY